MAFHRGDKISFINEALYGVVVDQMTERHVLVECQGIEMDVSIDEIIKIEHIPKVEGKHIFPIKKAIKKIDELPDMKIESRNSSSISVGDIVSFMSDNSRGRVIAKLNDSMFDVEIESGFSIPVNRLEIEKVWQTDSNFNVKGIEKKIKKDLDKTLPVLLHIDNLTDAWSHLSNFENVIFQVSAFRKRLYQAFEDNENQLIVIHGVGKGVLKDKIIEVVNLLPNISIQPADMKIYGMGASQIVIH